MKFILGDYFTVKFPAGKFDGVLTDIPYKGCLKGKFNEGEFSFRRFLEKTDRETKPDAFLITFANFLSCMDLINASKATNWAFHTHQIWDKRPVRTWISWRLPLRHTEYILYFRKGAFSYSFTTGEIKPGYKRTSFGGSLKPTSPNEKRYAFGMHSEIIAIRPERDKIHPAQKPVQFSHYFKSILRHDYLVLDPFMGSGGLITAFDRSYGVDLVNYPARTGTVVETVDHKGLHSGHDLLSFLT